MAYITYQALFVNTINQIISSLTTGTQPAKDPGMTAWTWFLASSGAQPPQVNEWASPQLTIGMKTVYDPWYTATNNWNLWSNALNTTLSSALGDVRKWLDLEYQTGQEDPPTVPEDVINWTKQNLPTVSPGVVIRKAQKARA